ncbi:Uu.00g136940.m01.CDS01 [Anthostomella pinea]|uniref:non-specific serine/threonine protein kinase n=1 Tax=Anthostomella pinea TaxID=933095 RepID=A0AAI8VQ70_9PEZI|nr:Uu.00g136940.m01.CDS01 [Anthostomella pinea]
MKDILIQGRYRVDRKIGEGGFGLVYSGTDLDNGNEVAIKIMESRNDPRELKEEADTYRALAGKVGIPQVYWFGEEGSYYVLVLELLGPSLEDLFNYCDRRFSLKTILLIADQAISRIEDIHGHVLHRDIKPDNFLMGISKQGNILYTIDFGLAREFFDDKQDRGYQGLPFGGTTRYASIKNHKGLEQSWGDDLESLGYMLPYFARGSLPWQGLKAATEDKKRELVQQKKMALSGEELCRDLLPAEFAKYIDYTRSLGFQVKPDYRYLRTLFRTRFQSEGFKYDNVFDWTIKRFDDIHESVENQNSAR